MIPFMMTSDDYDDDNFVLQDLVNKKNEEREKNALIEMQLKIDFISKDQNKRLETFASVMNESIVKQNEENERFRQSIQHSVNMHLQTFIKTLQPIQDTTKENAFILKNAIDMCRISKLNFEKLASLIEPLFASNTIIKDKMTFLEQEVIELNKRVKILEINVKELTDFDSFLITPPSSGESTQLQSQIEIEPKPKRSHKRKSPSS